MVGKINSSASFELGEFVFHHIGCATKSIQNQKSFFKSFGYEAEAAEFSDANQGIRGCFLVGPGPRLELLENLPGSATLTPWLDAGITFYHFAYEVARIDLALDWAVAQRARVIVPPIGAVAFEGREISFVFFRNKSLIEFIQK